MITEAAFDQPFEEVWIYNVLQHVIDPIKVIENAKRLAPVLRIFEWIDLPAYEGHPHALTKEGLESWIGQPGATVNLNTRGCGGRAFHGVFNFQKVAAPTPLPEHSQLPV